jgi:hypothetical protein
VPQQLHLDLTVTSVEELETQHERVLRLGGRLLYDRGDDPEEPLRGYAEPGAVRLRGTAWLVTAVAPAASRGHRDEAQRSESPAFVEPGVDLSFGYA